MSRKKNDRHHVIPRARGGGYGNNIVELPRTFHNALHVVFQDLKPEEYAKFLEAVLQPGTRWTSKQLHVLRQQCKTYNK